MTIEEKEKVWAAVRSIPNDLRAKGLVVAVHNDYKLNGKQMTFWLMTCITPEAKASKSSGIQCVAFQGEGETDQEALDQIRAKYAKYSDKLHHAPMCPANHYEGMRAPTYSCTCGATKE